MAQTHIGREDETEDEPSDWLHLVHHHLTVRGNILCFVFACVFVCIIVFVFVFVSVFIFVFAFQFVFVSQRQRLTLIRERGKPQAVLRMILIRGHSREHCLSFLSQPPSTSAVGSQRTVHIQTHTHTHEYKNTNTYLQTQTPSTSELRSQHTQSYSIQIHTYVTHKYKNTNM